MLLGPQNRQWTLKSKNRRRKEEFGVVGVFFVMNERTFWLCGDGPAPANRGRPFPIPSFSLPRVFDDSHPAQRPHSFSIVVHEEIIRPRRPISASTVVCCVQLAG